ncbi:hypothetical protein THIOSC15_1120007 [uncultured Thiomicrorhabdus sp.]
MSIRSLKGFSLLELSIALIILGLIIILFDGVFKLVVETDERLEQIYESRKVKDALETYLAVNSRLPCPDRDTAVGDGISDGYEDIVSTNATGDIGTTDDDVSYCRYSSGGLPMMTLV